VKRMKSEVNNKKGIKSMENPIAKILLIIGFAVIGIGIIIALITVSQTESL
jgi:hypothetical protein